MPLLFVMQAQEITELALAWRSRLAKSVSAMHGNKIKKMIDDFNFERKFQTLSSLSVIYFFISG
jgi:hypothetical protein